ncbi:MAG TPA: hypothetical protein VFA68_15100 [Terriglobales bacterium]|nr:hypothetical protein [Terriglobales bacterium]
MKLLLLAVYLAVSAAPSLAQQTSPCPNGMEEAPSTQCPHNIPLPPEQFQATPLSDGDVNTKWPHNPFGIPPLGVETVTLYGSYGNDEQSGVAKNHFDKGVTEGNKIQPLCGDGSLPNSGSCTDGSLPAIVFLFIGFSNCTLEVCGGSRNIWQSAGNIGVSGQACATDDCPNPINGNLATHRSWNRVLNDPIAQESLLYQAYGPQHFLPLNSQVYIFDGARGGETLDRWDPNGYYRNVTCPVNNVFGDGECNYKRVQGLLTPNGFTEKQVQAIFIKVSTEHPQCDLSGLHCLAGVNTPDAYVSEQYMGNILRYLKCCSAVTQLPRYPNLHQVFISSRIYGGYAQNPPTGGTNGCLSPEPYAYQTVTKL